MQTSEVVTKTKWNIDKANSQIGFSIKYLVFSNVRGSFKEFDANIYTTADNFMSAEVDFWLAPASIDTGVEQRDAHLRSADFFDVEKFREINFKANAFVEGGKDGGHELYGDLTIKEIKKEIKLNVESGGIIKDPWGTDKAVFRVTGKINRKDWGLNWNALLETGGVLVGEEVSIHCEVQLTRQS